MSQKSFSVSLPRPFVSPENVVPRENDAVRRIAPLSSRELREPREPRTAPVQLFVLSSAPAQGLEWRYG